MGSPYASTRGFRLDFVSFPFDFTAGLISTATAADRLGSSTDYPSRAWAERSVLVYDLLSYGCRSSHLRLANTSLKYGEKSGGAAGLSDPQDVLFCWFCSSANMF